MFNQQSGFNKDSLGLGLGVEKKSEMENKNLSQADVLYVKSKREDDKEENNDDFDEKDYWNDEEWEEYKKKQPRTEELGTPQVELQVWMMKTKRKS